MKEVGGGRVSGFQDKNTVLVEDADGFAIPMPISEVVVEGGESYEGGTWSSRKDEQKAKAQNAAKATPQKNVSATKTADKGSEFRPAPFERSGGEKLNVCLAFVPNAKDGMAHATFDAYIINDCNYYLSLSWLSAQGTAWRTRYAGTVEPNSKEFLEEISLEQIDEISRIAVQMTFCKRGKPFALKPAISVEMRIDGTKFYKAGAFRQTPFFEEPALVLDVVKDDEPVRTVFAGAGQIRDALMSRKNVETAVRHTENEPERARGENEVEVNLHDYALFDSTAGLSNADILNRQLQVVRETMEKYRRRKGMRIIFIHGKGEGVLRAGVLRELKLNYPSCITQDASFQEYGFGATQVTVR